MLQINGHRRTVAVEIGKVWFAAPDIVTKTFAPDSFAATTGQLVGGTNAVIGLSVTTAGGLTTTFGVLTANRLDVDRDPLKIGPDFCYISESPSVGVGEAYARLQLEKIVVSDTALSTRTEPFFSILGGYVPLPITITPSTPQLIGTNANNRLNDASGNDYMDGRAGNDRITSGSGNGREGGALGFLWNAKLSLAATRN